MSETTVPLSAKILAVHTPHPRVTAANRALKLLGLIENEKIVRQIIAENRDELGRMRLLAQAIAGTLPKPDEVAEGDREQVEAARQKAANLGRNTPDTHWTVTDMYDRLSEMRLDWQAERILQFGEAWIKAKTVVSNREAANGEFVDSGLNTKVDAYAGMPVGNKDERQAKLDAGFALMDALRAPLGRCPECIRKGAKRPGELAANTRTGKPFELCSDCYREKRATEGPRPTAAKPAAANDDGIKPAVTSSRRPKKGSAAKKMSRTAFLAKKTARGKPVKPDGEAKRQGGKPKGDKRRPNSRRESDEE